MKITNETKKLIRQKFFPHGINYGYKVIYSTAGIPASGKSTFIEIQFKNGTFPNNSYRLNPDLIMEALPEYQNDYKTMGKEEAFKLWELPARELAYEFFWEAITLKIPVIKDMGNVRIENYHMLSKVKFEFGYKVKIYWIHLEPEEAIKRIISRERYTPKKMVYERYHSLINLFEKYFEISDEFYFVDNSNRNKNFEILCKKKNNKLFCLKKDKIPSFINSNLIN